MDKKKFDRGNTSRAKSTPTPKDAKLGAEYEEYLKKRLAEPKKQRGEN